MENEYKNEADYLINKLMDYYEVKNYRELSEKINTTQQLISGWKLRNAVKAILNKLNDLGIQDDFNKTIKHEEYNLGDYSVGKVTGGVGISHVLNNALYFLDEYKKIEQLAKMGRGYDNLESKLKELKELLKEDV
jgi:cell fate (sporulation/competence/biofilm development) regulator YmcA (YheA/YmcA/DUF963 family)